jgi:hypothetical protein
MSYEQELEKQIEEMHQKLVQSERNAFVFRKIAEYVIENSTVTLNTDADTGKPNGGFWVKSQFTVREQDLEVSNEYPEARRFFDTLHAKAEPPDDTSVPF